MSRKLSANTLRLLFRLGEGSGGHHAAKWWGGWVGGWLESFDICGLPLPLWSHFSLAGVEEAASGSSKGKAKVLRGVRAQRSLAVDLEKCANWAPSGQETHFPPLSSRSFFFFPPSPLPSSHLSLLLLPLQVVYFTEMHKIFSELTEQIDQAGLTDEQRERETEAKLSELRALSIVADD